MSTSRMKVCGPTKVCKACKRELARRHFHATGSVNPHDGLRYGDHTCKDCRRNEKRAAGVRVRHERYNNRGDVWCNHCSRYRHRDHFKPHPSPNRAGTFMAYCKDCTRIRDQARYRRRTVNYDQAIKELEQRTAARRRRRAKIVAERRTLVVTAIDTLNRRGFTITEISRLSRLSAGNLYRYLDKADRVKISPAVERRFVELLKLTAHLPIGSPARKRLKPHPDFDQVLQASADLVERFPTRNGWKNGNRRRSNVSELPVRNREDVAA